MQLLICHLKPHFTIFDSLAILEESDPESENTINHIFCFFKILAPYCIHVSYEIIIKHEFHT
jgi:hypothetical protein